MNITLIASIAGLVTAFCWGTSDYLAARSSKRIGALETNFALQLSSLAIVGLVFAIYGVHVAHLADLGQILLSSLLLNIAFVIFLQALSKGAVGIIVPLSAIYPLFTILLSMVFSRLEFSTVQLGAMLIIVFGAAILAYEKNHANIPLKQLHRKTVLALSAAIIWGVSFFIIGPVTQRVSWQSISIITESLSLCFAIVLLFAANRWNTVVAMRRALKAQPAIVAGLFGEVGLMTFYLGTGHAGSVIIPVVLSSTGPLVTSFYGVVFDRERIGTYRRAGAVLTVAGVIILNLA